MKTFRKNYRMSEETVGIIKKLLEMKEEERKWLEEKTNMKIPKMSETSLIECLLWKELREMEKFQEEKKRARLEEGNGYI